MGPMRSHAEFELQKRRIHGASGRDLIIFVLGADTAELRRIESESRRDQILFGDQMRRHPDPVVTYARMPAFDELPIDVTVKTTIIPDSRKPVELTEEIFGLPHDAAIRLRFPFEQEIPAVDLGLIAGARVIESQGRGTAEEDRRIGRRVEARGQAALIEKILRALASEAGVVVAVRERPLKLQEKRNGKEIRDLHAQLLQSVGAQEVFVHELTVGEIPRLRMFRV